MTPGATVEYKTPGMECSDIGFVAAATPLHIRLTNGVVIRRKFAAEAGEFVRPFVPKKTHIEKMQDEPRCPFPMADGAPCGAVVDGQKYCPRHKTTPDPYESEHRKRERRSAVAAINEIKVARRKGRRPRLERYEACIRCFE